jgi:predicted phosphohydrolase
MKNDIKLLQIIKQMNIGHLIVLYQKGEKVKEYDLSLGIEESKKKISSINETKQFLLGDTTANPDLSIVHDNPHTSNLFWREYSNEDQEKREKEFIQSLSSQIKKLERNVDRTIKLIHRYHTGDDDGLLNEFRKYVEEVVEEGGL